MSIIERIKQIIEYKGISTRKFCIEIGVANGFFDKVKDVGSEKVLKILNRYPEINPEWLLTGNGEMLITNRTDLRNPSSLQSTQTTDYKREDSNNNSNPQEKTKKNNIEGFPLIPVEAMMGYGSGDVQVMDYEIQEDYIITPELSGKGIKYLIRASGSSMTPKYNNGDLLACRPITDISFIQWGKVYVLDTDQGPLVKRLYQCNPAEENFLECRSENYERYPPFKINKESIRRIAIVVAVLRLE